MARGIADSDPDPVLAGPSGGRFTRRPRRPLLIAALVGAVVALTILLVVSGSSPSTDRSGHSDSISRPSASQPLQTPPSTTTTPSTTATGTPLLGPSWASGNGGLAPAVAPTATPDSFLNGIFSGQLGPGWIGGDSCYSTQLADGRVAFVFSDTMIGTARSDGAAAISGLTRSSELVGHLPKLVSDYAGSARAPGTALIPDALGRKDTWQTAATTTLGSNQLIFVNEFKPAAGSIFQTFLGRSGIAVMSVPTGGLPSLGSVVPLPTDPDTQWGNAVLQTSGYLYVYGSDVEPSTGTILGMKVRARASESVPGHHAMGLLERVCVGRQ